MAVRVLVTAGSEEEVPLPGLGSVWFLGWESLRGFTAIITTAGMRVQRLVWKIKRVNQAISDAYLRDAFSLSKSNDKRDCFVSTALFLSPLVFKFLFSMIPATECSHSGEVVKNWLGSPSVQVCRSKSASIVWLHLTRYELVLMNSPAP